MKSNGEMTLNEAIEHLENLLAENTWNCSECKLQYKQLLEWLKELRSLKTRVPIHITEEKFRGFQRVQRAGDGIVLAPDPKVTPTEYMFMKRHYDELVKKFGHLEDGEEYE